MTRRFEVIGVAALVGVWIVSLLIVDHDAYQRALADAKLKANADSIRVAEKVSRADSVTEAKLKRSADSAVAKAAHSDSLLTVSRAKIVVRHDTVYTDGQMLVLPNLANFVRASDTHTADADTAGLRLIADNAALNVRIVDLTKQLTLEKNRVAQLEHEKSPRFGLKTGIVIGAVVAVVASKPAAVFAGILHALKQVQH